MKENVYLIPLANGTYAPCVAEDKPRTNAILLTGEQSYPTLLSYLVYDAYGCGQIYGERIHNRTELLGFLFTCGEMCYGLEKLWDYDICQGITDDLQDLFNKAYDTWTEAVRGDGAVNAVYAFTNTTTLQEYCVHCKRTGGREDVTDHAKRTELGDGSEASIFLNG